MFDHNPVAEYYFAEVAHSQIEQRPDGKPGFVAVIDVSPAQFWDLRAVTYGSHAGVYPADREVMDAELENQQRNLDQFLSPPLGQILDYGCGTGRFAEWLSARGTGYLGVDISPQMILWAERLHSTNKFMLIIGTRIPAPNAVFDTVFCSNVVKHILDDDELKHWIGEMIRILKVGGRIVILEGVCSGPAEHIKDRPIDAYMNLLIHGFSDVQPHPISYQYNGVDRHEVIICGVKK